MATSKALKLAALGSSIGLILSGCASAETDSSSGGSSSGGSSSNESPIELSLWSHEEGNEALEILQKITDEYNSSQSEFEVVIQAFPGESYNDSIVAAGAANDLPCIIDVDGPIMPNWAWAGYMQPLQFIDQDRLDKVLDGAKGYYNGELYAIGVWDAATAIITRQSILDAYGIRTPTVDSPWTRTEFDAALSTLQAGGEFEHVLDMGTAWTGEWYPYAYSPFLQSFGGDLIDRSSYTTAEGTLNGTEAVEFGKWFQNLFASDLVSPQEPGDRGRFREGKVAMQFNGNWDAPASYEVFGDDLLVLPPPDFGNGPVIGAASWQFGVSGSCEHPEGAEGWINFALQDKYLVEFSNLIGLIPATAAASAESELYYEGSPFEDFVDLSNQFALIRPPTPAYPVIAKEFEKAMADIRDGKDVQAALDAAVDAIDADLAANNFYN